MTNTETALPDGEVTELLDMEQRETLAEQIENETTIRRLMGPADAPKMSRRRAEMVVRLAARNIRADGTGQLTKTRALAEASGVEFNADGDPQVFPYDHASSRVLGAVATLDPADGSREAEHLREVAGSIRDHRKAFQAGHTTRCRGDLHRGLCH